MELQEAVRRRRMVRAFEGRPIPHDVVERVVVNAQRGPSSGFTQGFDFLVFDGPDQTKRFWDATPWGTGEYLAATRPAPLVIVPVAHAQAYVDRYLAPDKLAAGRRGPDDFPAPYWFIDSGMAAMLILLTAVDAGLGAFYFSVGANVRQIPRFRAALGIPDAYWPIGAIALGYPSPEDPSAATELRKTLRARRRRAEARIHRGHW